MPYTVDASTADCYAGTTVLINRFDIRSQHELDAIEATLVSAKAALWEEAPLCSSFDFIHYKAIHKYLFGEIYPWAGETRTVNISKKGTQFCPAKDIERVGGAVFGRLARQNYFKALPYKAFVCEMADFYARLNELHPFRDGNGRTQRVFLAQLAQNAGYCLDFAGIDADSLMLATIQSANGVDDYLREIFYAITTGVL